MKRYIMLWLMCAAIAGVQILYAGQENERERTAFNEGYAMVLNKQWNTAVEHLQKFINNHPESSFIDDAAYWKAYALRHIDKEKSAEAYRSFIEKYPDSRYIDDAVADLHSLPTARRVRVTDIEREVLRANFLINFNDGQLARHPALAQQLMNARYFANLAQGFVSGEPLARESPDEKVRHDKELQLRLESIQALIRISPDDETINYLQRIITDKNEHRDIRLYTLHALARTENYPVTDLLLTLIGDDNDEALRPLAIQLIGSNARHHSALTFQLLRDIALDKQENERIRFTAIRSLSQFEKFQTVELLKNILDGDDDIHIRQFALQSLAFSIEHDPAEYIPFLKSLILDPNRDKRLRYTALNILTQIDHPSADKTEVLLHIVQNDPDKDMRHFAIVTLTRIDKDISVQTLEKLLHSPKMQDLSTLGVLLHSLASVGSEKAVEIIAQIARTHENHEIRLYAVRMLGNIGGEKARAVLYEILTQ